MASKEMAASSTEEDLGLAMGSTVVGLDAAANLVETGLNAIIGSLGEALIMTNKASTPS